MYPINPFMSTPAVVPLTMEAFVAPANFDPDAQELNIVKAFAAYPNADKKYIFSVGTSTSTVLPAVTGRSYAYSQNGGAYTNIVSGTITWTVGSTKRNVVVIYYESGGIVNDIPIGAIWGYFGEKCSSISSVNNIHLKYIHFQNINTLVSLKNDTFYGCSGLSGTINIPNSLTYLSQAMFYGCAGLTSVIIPSSVISIGGYAFYGCTGLTSFIIPSSVTSIGAYAFYGCTGLTSIIIPSSVTSLEYRVFKGCTGLTSVIIPSSVISIGDEAFQSCIGLTSIIIPSSVEIIGSAAFAFCNKLSYINIHISNPIIINNITFYNVNKAIPLHVPVGSLAAYQAAPYWNEFTNIIDDL